MLIAELDDDPIAVGGFASGSSGRKFWDGMALVEGCCWNPTHPDHPSMRQDLSHLKD